MRRALVLAGLVLPALAALGGCAFWRPTTVPIPQLAYPARCAAPAPAQAGAAPRPLLVLLPGRFMDPGEFASHGIVDALRRRGIDADVVVVDAHLGYYRERTVLERLEADVIAPAQARGVTQVWLVGISMGAFGAMLYSDAHPGDRTIAGIVALGPYLGEPRAGEQVRAAGGLRAWRAPAGIDVPSADPDLERARGELRVWQWLQGHAAPGADAPPRAATALPPLWVGFGDDDRFLADDRLLVGALPADRVATHAGGHDWDAWTPLWETLLDRLPLPRRVACEAPARVAG